MTPTRPASALLIMAAILCAALATGCPSQPNAASSVNSPPYIVPDGLETRWASAENPKAEVGKGGTAEGGRKGSPNFKLEAGATRILAEEKGGSGTIRRIWCTFNDRSAQMLRGIRIDMYWDDALRPAVSAPIGDFFCMGLGRMYAFESEYFSSPEGRSFNCCIPMPFKKGMRIVVTNTTNVDLPMFYYDVDYTLGDAHGSDVLYFHAYWRRENPTAFQKDFEILPQVSGKGRFLGCNLGVTADTGEYFNSWWGEGECKIFLDGDTEYPTLCGTGTEDYIGTGWFLGAYANRYQGCPLADHDKMQFCFYRFHVPDPVYFRKGIRVTMQQIGCWLPESKPKMVKSGKAYYYAAPGKQAVDWTKGKGTADYGLFERQDDWSCCAYFYLDAPMSSLPPIAGYQDRVDGLL